MCVMYFSLDKKINGENSTLSYELCTASLGFQTQGAQ